MSRPRWTRSRRVGIPGVLLVVALIVLPAAAASAHSTYTSPDCLHLRMRPEKIIFACGDGAYFADQLTWQSWHVGKAKGVGVFHQDDCRPDCAEGTFRERSGRLVLRNRTWCAGLHKHVFKRAHVVYDKPLLGHRRAAFGLVLPKRC